MELSLSKARKIILIALLSVVGLLPIFLLSSCKPLSQEWVVNNLFPNLWVFLSHLIAAAILIVVMTWLLWKPTKNMLQKRHEFIAKQIEDSIKNKEMTAMELQEANQLKVDALSQAMSITTKARAEAFDIVENAKADARKESLMILKNAEKDIEKTKEQVTANAQDNIINIAFDVAKEILDKEVSKQDKDKYIDELLDSIESDLKKNK